MINKMEVKSFTKFINEGKIYESVTLYRAVAVGEGEDLVVDTKNPGKYYFKNKSDVDPSILSKVGTEYHIVEVTTDEGNIDEELSRLESEKNGCDCVVLIDDTDVGLDSITPLKD